MLQGTVKRNTRAADYGIWQAAKFEWGTDDYETFPGNGQLTVVLKNEDLGQFEAVAVKAVCDNCKEKLTVLYVAYGQMYTCENCSHTHEISKQQADDAGLNWIV